MKVSNYDTFIYIECAVNTVNNNQKFYNIFKIYNLCILYSNRLRQ